MTHSDGFAAWQWAILSLYSLILGGVLGRHLLCHLILRRTTFLTIRSPSWESPDPPKVTILVPAKDEAENIRACLASLLRQDYPNFEVVVVDDRSNDSTAEIAEDMARTDQRVRVIRITELPEGWTGKTHALHVGQRSAHGEWLFFVDADAALHPRCLSVMLRDAVEHDANLASLLPRMEMRSFWERAVQPFAATMLMVLFPLPRVNDRTRLDCGFANGQFLLINRKAYDAIGGHAAVRDKFCEDINLGRLIKRHRLGLRVTAAPELASVRMYASLAQIVRGWCRIFYAAADAKATVPATFAAVMFVLGALPYFVLPGCGMIAASGAAGGFTWCLLGFALTQEALQTGVYARAYRAGRCPLRLLAWRWLATAVMITVLLRTVRLCKTHRVEWRGTKYLPLPQATSEPVLQNAA